MMCDIVIAADDAKFGQPEIKLGIIPGAGGTQRLPRAVGKAKAMDLCLTARMMDAVEAERAGLVSRVVAPERLLDEALRRPTTIAAFSRPIAMMIKESVNRAYETTLARGSCSSGASSTRRSPRTTRTRAWLHLVRSAAHFSEIPDIVATRCRHCVSASRKRFSEVKSEIFFPSELTS